MSASLTGSAGPCRAGRSCSARNVPRRPPACATGHPGARWYCYPPAPAPTPIVTVGVVPVRPVASLVSVGTSCSSNVPFQVTSTFAVLTGPPRGLDVVGADVAERPERRLDLRAVALNASGAVVWPLNVSVNVPPVALVDADRLVLVGLLVDALTPVAGVAAAGGAVVTRDEPQVVVLVEVDVAGDVAAARGCSRRAGSAARSRGRGAPARRGVVDELEARELEVADPRVPRAESTAWVGAAPSVGGREVVRVPGRAVGVA